MLLELLLTRSRRAVNVDRLLHCDFNTGLVYLRSSNTTLAFAERWKETVASAREKRIRDQAAFNMMTKLRRPEPLRVDGKIVPRLFTATNGGDGTIKLGVLPLNRYLNGHTFFVQHEDYAYIIHIIK